MSLQRNRLGYWEVQPRPSEHELASFYMDIPLGSSTGYNLNLSDDELFHRTIGCLEAQHMLSQDAKSFLDIGCGEGFFLNHFDNLGLSVHGIDYSVQLLRHHFPHLLSKVQVGNLEPIVERFSAESVKFDFISANNVIEHVADPVGVLERIKAIMSPSGLLRVSVPNDFSDLQLEAVRRGYGKENFWVSIPSHLNYFNVDSFRKFLISNGFNIVGILADFPTDFYLFHSASNYVFNKNEGRSAHKARIEIENLLAKKSIESLIAYREGCAKAGVGRNLVAYCQLPHLVNSSSKELQCVK
jgi:2-polyprenyl-3-methyl-5-hydroxy-6-metoxy-1,4-benzoquinol methylase